MRIFMFSVIVLFAALGLLSVVAAIIMLIMGNIVGMVVGLIAAVVFWIMSNSISKSYRETA